MPDLVVTDKPDQLVRLLDSWNRGRTEVVGEVIPLLYDELRGQAARILRSELRQVTVHPTLLVHEVYLRLLAYRRPGWQGRAHFFGSTARLMRRILVDYARRRHAQRRDAKRRITTWRLGRSAPLPPTDLLALDRALDRLAVLDAGLARVVELRYFGGLTNEETAGVMGISVTEVKREWSAARAWLAHELRGGLQ